MRLALATAIVVLLTVTLAGCGDSSEGTASTPSAPRAPGQAGGDGAPAGASAQTCAAKTAGVREVRVTGLSCEQGEAVIVRWGRLGACAAAARTARSGCGAGPYRCLNVKTARGMNVSCARPGRSVAFTVKP